MDKVLVLDCWMRKGLSVIRALGREGLEVHCCSHKSISPARFSKYTKRFFIFPDPEIEPKKFKKMLVSLLKENRYSSLIPLEEPTIELILEFRDEIERYTKIALVDKIKFERAVDKWNSVRLAKKVGIPVPESYCPQNESEVNDAIKKIGFPLIIKPRKTSGGRGLKKINNRGEFDENYPSIVKRFGRPMIQEYIGEGPGVLVWLIVRDGKILADFSYERLRKYPMGSGPGTMWVSTDNKKIKKYSEDISKALDWHGIIIVEFKMDPKDNKPKFMEINPRLGGSTAHPLVCGVNFPYILYLLALNKKIIKPKYVVGRKTRWLAADIMHFVSNKKRWSMNPSFFTFLDKNTFYEEFDSTDMKGNIWIMFNYFLNFFDFEIWKKGVLRK